jgi:hypothetical protein
MQTRKARVSVASLVLILATTTTGGSVTMAAAKAHAVYEPDDPVLVGAKNFFLNAEVSASPHWSDRGPHFAVDGRHDNPGDHWAAENIPVQLTVHLPTPADLNFIRLWTFWGDGRYYQYLIEGSQDGQQWTILADNRSNTKPATADGENFFFPTTRVQQVRVTFTYNSVSNVAGGHIVEIEGYHLPDDAASRLAAAKAAWAAQPPGLHGAVGSTDVRYPRDQVPLLDGAMQWSATAWRGERVNAQLLLWTADGATQTRLVASPLRGDAGEIPASCIRARFVRYVLADGQLVPDVLDSAQRLDIPARTARPIWVTIDVPADARPGIYSGTLTARATGAKAVKFDLRLEVLPARLPPPGEWTFWLDLWQNPFAVARYHGVEPWSPQHFAVLEPHLRMLADAGQKCITTTIVHQPWGTQTYDPYESMVEWIRHADGTWSFDYSRFDSLVELALRCGIRGSINCYSMVPWGDSFRYLDEETSDYKTIHAAPGTEEYARHWRPFLADFVEHLRARGWLGRTAIAMDERPAHMMKPMLALLRAVAPDLKVALAGGNEPELKEDVDDWCVFISPPLDSAIARERTAKGKPTTFYVCCGPARPNTFTFSPPAEAAWMGWYAAAQGYSGFLRWAYDSWTEDPLHDTSYVTWPAGDCFLVYPGPRSSIRFERLREGIQDYEKVRIIRAALENRNEAAAREGLAKLEAALALFSYEAAQKMPAAEVVAAARKTLEDLARQIFPP